MLLNINIFKKYIQMTLHFQKKINVMMYITKKSYELNLNHFI
jgi:hypothetical protein